MKVIVVSDLHFEKGFHRGVWEGDSASWLLRLVEDLKPDALVGLGDHGHAWIPELWNELVSDTLKLNLIYGNHDNVELLKTVRNSDGGRAWAKDGETRLIGGVRFGFINGIVAYDGEKRVKDGVPRQTPEDYLQAARQLEGVDVLCTHEAPRAAAYRGHVHNSLGTETVEKAVEIVNPSLLLCGHLSGPYALGSLGRSVVVRVDSSPSDQHYAMLNTDKRTVTIFHNREAVASTRF
jgi:Icc-related predicted phosphoesterase